MTKVMVTIVTSERKLQIDTHSETHSCETGQKMALHDVMAFHLRLLHVVVICQMSHPDTMMTTYDDYMWKSHLERRACKQAGMRGWLR